MSAESPTHMIVADYRGVHYDHGVVVAISDEDILDYGIGSVADQTAAWTRLYREERALERYWTSLPIHLRLTRTVRGKMASEDGYFTLLVAAGIALTVLLLAMAAR